MSAQPGADTPSVEFRNVSLAFDGPNVLTDVTFTLRRGEMIVVTGVSGCGKSVLLRLAIGLLHPIGGQVLLEGDAIESLSEEELLDVRSRRMGFVFQENALFTGISVFENTAFRLTEHQWDADRVAAAVDEILRFVGLEKDAEKLPGELSIGMGRRLEIARALVGWPSIMLYDEPTAGLDPIIAKQVLDLIIRARDIHGISSLYVTKEMYEIPYLASHRAVADPAGAVRVEPVETGAPSLARVLLLEGGRIRFDGPAAEFMASEHPVVRHMTHPESTLPVRDIRAEWK